MVTFLDEWSVNVDLIDDDEIITESGTDSLQEQDVHTFARMRGERRFREDSDFPIQESILLYTRLHVPDHDHLFLIDLLSWRASKLPWCFLDIRQVYNKMCSIDVSMK